MDLVLVAPRPRPGVPSGGHTVNAELVTAARTAGHLVRLQELDGPWPWPEAGERAALADALLAAAGPVLLDGLVGCCCPDEVEQAVAAGVRITLLVHLPLPDETGLAPQQRDRMAAAERRAVHAASAVLTTSRWAAAELSGRYALPPGRVHPLVPGGRPAQQAAGSDPPRLLALGSLTPRKNHPVLLDALEQLLDLPWTAVLAGPDGGEPGYAARLRQQVAGGPLAGRVQLPGAVTGDALERLWDGTDLLVLPSLAETFGLVVTEALAHGVPALVPAGTGAVEALRGPGAGTDRPDAALDPDPRLDPGAGLDPRDTEAWAQQVRAWLSDPALRERWRTAAGRRRAQLPSWEDAARDMVQAVAGA